MPDLIGGISQPVDAIRDLKGLLRGRSPDRQASFKGVPFYVNTSDNEFGRRTVLYQYPQFDTPATEDMGRKARRFQIQAMLIGRDWENERDQLIAVCEQPGPGLLVHPDYGEFRVMCESCAVTESKVNQYFRADVALTFVESGANPFPARVTNPLLALRNSIADLLETIKDLVTAVYVVANLPAYVASYIKTLLGTSSAPAKLPNNNAKAALVAMGIVDPADGPSTVTAVVATVQAVTRDIVTRGLTETSGGITAIRPADTSEPNSVMITPYRAIEILGQWIAQPSPLVTGKTPVKEALRRTARATHALFQATAAIEAARAQTYIKYQSLSEARTVWDTVLGYVATAEATCAAGGFDGMRDALVQTRALIVADMQERAPALARITYREVRTPTPALAVVYDAYESTARVEQFVRRNRVKHPGFVAGERLELLS